MQLAEAAAFKEGPESGADVDRHAASANELVQVRGGGGTSLLKNFAQTSDGTEESGKPAVSLTEEPAVEGRQLQSGRSVSDQDFSF